MFPHRNHPEADQRGRGVVELLAVDADVVARIEEAAAVCDAVLIDHLRHVTAHIEQAEITRVMRIDLVRMPETAHRVNF